MLNKTLHALLSAQAMPQWIRQHLPWDTEKYAQNENNLTPAKKVQTVPRCRRCGLCMTSNHPCPVLTNKPLE